jgi:hypothetical protein
VPILNERHDEQLGMGQYQERENPQQQRKQADNSKPGERLSLSFGLVLRGPAFDNLVIRLHVYCTLENSRLQGSEQTRSANNIGPGCWSAGVME